MSGGTLFRSEDLVGCYTNRRSDSIESQVCGSSELLSNLAFRRVGATFVARNAVGGITHDSPPFEEVRIVAAIAVEYGDHE